VVSVRNLALLFVGASMCAWAAACPAADTPPVDDDADVEIAPPPYDSLAGRPCPPDSALTWENFGQPYMLSWCTSCHSSALDEEHRALAPLDVNFDDLDGVRAQAEQIWNRSGDQNNTMPPAGVAPALERAQLGEWLACGAPSRND
jgi:hypothetical protein